MNTKQVLCKTSYALFSNNFQIIKILYSRHENYFQITSYIKQSETRSQYKSQSIQANFKVERPGDPGPAISTGGHGYAPIRISNQVGWLGVHAPIPFSIPSGWRGRTSRYQLQIKEGWLDDPYTHPNSNPHRWGDLTPKPTSEPPELPDVQIPTPGFQNQWIIFNSN